MKLILFIIIVFCISVKAQTADTLKLSDGNPLLLSNGQAVLLFGEAPPAEASAILRGSNGKLILQPGGRNVYLR